MTLRNAPLSGTGWQIIRLICISEKQKYFFEKGWTAPRNLGMGREVICPSGSEGHVVSAQINWVDEPYTSFWFALLVGAKCAG
jgi:hypothetical protein